MSFPSSLQTYVQKVVSITVQCTRLPMCLMQRRIHPAVGKFAKQEPNLQTCTKQLFRMAEERNNGEKITEPNAEPQTMRNGKQQTSRSLCASWDLKWEPGILKPENICL